MGQSVRILRSRQDDEESIVAITGEQAVLDEHVRAAGKELERDLDATIASTQLWRQQQRDNFERLRAEAVASLQTAVVANSAPPEAPVPRCQPRPRRSTLCCEPANDENEHVAPRRPPTVRLGPSVSLG